jgi:hypothetical protein
LNLYVQNTGRLYNDHGALLGVGYAGGDQGKCPESVNNPLMQNVPFCGPLPCGFYKIGEPFKHMICGEYFLPLYPNPANDMLGRGGFGIHGDRIAEAGKKKASDGCIVMSRDVREAIWDGGDHELQVVSTLPFVAPDVNGEI